MAPLPDDLLLAVTAGPTYDPSTHKTVLVNSLKPTHVTSDVCTANIIVRVQNYRGLPRHSPTTSSYFNHPTHTRDRYSISFSLVPHQTIPGPALVFGNDIDHPVRDRLPYGTGTAFKIVKRLIDPGLEGDLYADRPHLYGCALSSIDVLRVGGKVEGDEGLSRAEGERDGVVEEGGDGDGVEWRKTRGVPEGAEARKKWFLGKGRAKTWDWEKGRVYHADFSNPYLDFNDTGDVLFVVVFSLLHKENVEEEEGEVAVKPKSTERSDHADMQESGESFQPKEDDVD
ncbi:MAG: hypothetical protein Q9163_002146 [Psora crenata]